MGTDETLESCSSLCRYSHLSPEKIGGESQIRFFFWGEAAATQAKLQLQP